jgi:hypothetical protein
LKFYYCNQTQRNPIIISGTASERTVSVMYSREQDNDHYNARSAATVELIICKEIDISAKPARVKGMKRLKEM